MRVWLILFCAAALIGFAPAQAARAAGEFDGDWLGAAEKDGRQFQLGLRVDAAGAKPKVLLTVPSGYARLRPVEHAAIENGKLIVGYEAAVDRTWAGPVANVRLELAPKDGALEGAMTFQDFSAPLTLRRVAERPNYSQEEVVFHNGEVKLAGTLYLPNVPRPCAAIVHMHGSGENPRHSFFATADFFARQGFACLFFDKRGTGESTGDWQKVGFEELADDGIAAAHYLQTRSEIDGKRIGMFGISQAGWIIPLAASRSKDIAFAIVVSGGPISVEREGRWDVEYWFPKKGYTKEEEAAALAYIKADDEFTKTGQGLEELKLKFQEARKQRWWKEIPRQMFLAPTSTTRLWFKRVYALDHPAIVESLSIPMLWIYGDDDESMPGPETASIVEGIKAKGNKDFTVKVFPRGDHGIRARPEGSPFPFREFVPGYLETMSDWLAEKKYS